MNTTRTRLARRLAAVVVGVGAMAFGAGVVMAPTHASAQGLPTKTCTDPSQASGEAEPGDTIICTLDINGLVANGTSYTVQPSAPTNAFIVSAGCTGATGGTAPFTYTTTVSDNGSLGNPSGTCTFTVSGTIGIGQNEIGTEEVKIPAATAAGTSVTQNITECLTSTACGPATPMGVNGPGSCVGGTAIPVIGGCEPGLPGSPSPSPTNTSTPTPSGTPGGPTPTPRSTPTPTSSVAGTKTTTPFTGGPDHPFPVAATGIAAGGLAIALAAGFGPMLGRRLRRADLPRDDR